MSGGSASRGPSESEACRRIALLVLVAPRDTAAELSISDLKTNHDLRCELGSFVLTLDAEPHATFTRGQLQSLSDRSTYPIQSNVALFDAIEAFIARAEATE